MRKILSVFFALTIMTINIIPVCAEPSKNAVQNTEKTIEDISPDLSYKKYLSDNADFYSCGETLKIGACDFVLSDGAELKLGDGLEWINGEGRVTWKINIPINSAYNLKFEYKALGEFSDPAEIAVLIDDKLPFEEADSVFLPLYWQNKGEIRTDMDGNQFAPEVQKIEGWYTNIISDPSGFSNEPFVFAFEAGEHTISINSLSQPFILKAITLVPIVTPPGYSEYLKRNVSKDYCGSSIIIEGEDASVRSKKSMVPLSDNSSANIEPHDAYKSRINYIGGKNWNRPGDTITWYINVPETGYYSLGFNYRQNTTINETFYRTLKIDGEIPFEQAKRIKFRYSGSWKNTNFTDEKENPYKIYLEKGKHSLSLSVTMGELSKICGELNSLVYKLAEFYRSIVMITGENPDANRDYSLFTQIPNYDGKINDYIKSLDSILNELYQITRSKSGSAATNLRNMKDVLERMLKNKYYAHQYKSTYYSNYAALSAWVYERSSMPVDIDAIFLFEPENTDTNRNVKVFNSIAFSLQRFFASFVSQYQTQNTSVSNESITLWVNSGRDQVKVLKNLTSNDFVVKSGIHVNIRVTNATLLQGILSGTGPDCSIQVSRSEPVNLAMRDGLYDLSQFKDYNEVMKRFMTGAEIPYNYNGKSYGLPNTQIFYMLFYRNDIFDQMGLSVPNTWDEFLNTSNLLLRQNMQVGLPYTQITDMSQVNAGVGALNILPTLLMQRGLSIYNDTLTASTLASSDTTEAFVQWTDYYNKFGFPKTYDFYNRFRVGLMPMAVVSYSMYAMLTAAAPEINQLWTMAPIPGTVREDGTIDRSVSGGGTAAVILKNSKRPDLAWEFIKWWTDADTQYSYANEIENILGASARHDTANVEALKRLSWDRESLKALLEQWNNVKEIPEIPGGYYLSRVIDQAFWNTTNGADPYEMTAKWGIIADNEIKRKSEQYGK